MLGGIWFQLVSAVGRVFGVALYLMCMALCSSSTLLMFGNEIRLYFEVSWWVVFGMVLSLAGFGGSLFHVGAAELRMVMVIFFGIVLFLLLLSEFDDLMRMDKAHWSRCLLWHGWLPMLSGVNGASPWAADASESAFHLVETALGRCSSNLLVEWVQSEESSVAGAVSSVLDHPTVWTDGSLVLDRVTGVSSSGAGFFAHQSDDCWSGRRWGHVDHVRYGGGVPSCGDFCSVPGPLQSVQRAEMWGVILALQSSGAVHLGVDNLGVVRHVGRLLDGRRGSIPF